MPKTKKLTKKELSELQELNASFNNTKTQLADIEINKMSVVASLASIKAKFGDMEKALIEKYGKDAVINIQTGQVTPNG